PARRRTSADPLRGRPRASVPRPRAAVPGVRRARGRRQRSGRGRGRRDREGAPALERVTVAVPERAYDVCIGSGVLAMADELLPALASAERAFVIADAPVAERYLPGLAEGLAERGLGVVHLGVPEGEEAKSLQVMNALERQLATQEAHRDDPILALGGGAVGDL